MSLRVHIPIFLSMNSSTLSKQTLLCYVFELFKFRNVCIVTLFKPEVSRQVKVNITTYSLSIHQFLYIPHWCNSILLFLNNWYHNKCKFQSRFQGNLQLRSHVICTAILYRCIIMLTSFCPQYYLRSPVYPQIKIS